MQCHRLINSTRFICLATCALSLIVCLISPKTGWANADENENPSLGNTSSVIPDDIAELINAYSYNTAFKRTQALLKHNLINEQAGKNLLTRIEKESHIHSKANIQTAYKLSRQYRWAEADVLLSALSTQVRDKEPVAQAKAVVFQNQNKQLLKIMSNTALQKQSWLQQTNEFNQLKNRSTQQNLLSRAKQHWINFKLNRHNLYLLKLAQKNHEIEEFTTSLRCLEAMEPEKLRGKSKYNFETLAALSFPDSLATVTNKKPLNKKNLNTPQKIHPLKTNTANSLRILTNLLEKNMRDNNLLAIKLNLNELAPLTTKRSSHKTLMDQAETLLENEIIKLDQTADDLYRTEQPLEAYEIWELLLQLDSDNAAIQQKFDRAKIVLGNMKALRAQGRVNPLPDIQ